MLRTLETVEDMRMATMQAGIVWDFETYPEYLDAVERRKPAINFGGYVGHTAVRVYVMGDDASERCATETELAAMRAVVADALRGGALGFSTDRAGFVAGADGRPVPSMIASQDEVEALMRVTAEVGRGIVHIAPGDNYEWLYDFQRTLGRHVNWSSILAYPEGSTTRTLRTAPSWRLTRRAGRRGADVWAQVTCRPIRQLVTLRDPAPFSTIPAFAEVLATDPEHRRERYADRLVAGTRQPRSSLRRRSRCCGTSSSSPSPTRIRSCSGARCVQSPMRAPANRSTCCAISRSMTTWRRDSRSRSPTTIRSQSSELLTGEGCILGLSDAGAHVSQICDAVLPTDFLARWVRDLDVMPLEQGVGRSPVSWPTCWASTVVTSR